MSSDWKESDFEHWFREHPTLPGGEQLLVVSCHQPLKRVVDILCLDENGGLVFLEVKNEKSTRTVVGQALEYLSQYEEAEVATVEEDFQDPDDKPLKESFLHLFGKALTSISPARRVLIVGPAFDVATAVAIDFLSRSFASSSISFALLRASTTGAGFVLEVAPKPDLRPVRELQGQFALHPRGRPLYVLPQPFSPLCWTLGKLTTDNELRLLGTAASTRNSVRIRTGHLIPMAPHPSVDVSGLGRGWRHRTRTSETAVEIGIVKGLVRGGLQRQYLVSISLRDGAFVKFRRRDLAKFRRDWIESDFNTEEHIKALLGR